MRGKFIPMLALLALISCQQESADESTYTRKFITTNPDPKPLPPKESLRNFERQGRNLMIQHTPE
ncbi:MAG TPA: hypothetical protein DHV26_02660 [Cytophagales bacterium]|nr:hypothetical protein [Cytophagales bacterium]